MKNVLASISMLAVAAVVARPVEAQARFGAHLAWAQDADFGIGARVGFPLGDELKRKGIEGLATFDYFFPKGYNLWEVSANGLYHFTQGKQVRPYVGAGIVLAHTSVGNSTIGGSGSDFGFNLLGGVRFKAQERLLPFVEARFELNHGSQFFLAGGVYFGKP